MVYPVFLVVLALKALKALKARMVLLVSEVVMANQGPLDPVEAVLSTHDGGGPPAPTLLAPHSCTVEELEEATKVGESTTSACPMTLSTPPQTVQQNHYRSMEQSTKTSLESTRRMCPVLSVMYRHDHPTS